MTVAIPYCAKVRVPVVAVPASRSVSVVIETVWLLPLLLKIVTAEPMGNATPELAGMTTPPVVMLMCLPMSDRASV